MGAHAIKNASGSKRWMNCPGSLRLAEGRHSESSEAAMLGTAAHFLGETCLRSGEDAEVYAGRFIGLDEKEDGHFEDELPLSELFPKGAKYKAIFPVDNDMVDAVQVYLDVCREEQAKYPGSEMFVERRFDLSWLRPDMFGTNDCSIFQIFEHLTIIDYKHGQGVVVEVQDESTHRVLCLAERANVPAPKGNSQLLYYALGIAKEVDWAFETLDLVIVQPRARHEEGGVRRYSTTKAELQAFEQILALAADDCDEPDAPLSAGTWCQFCPAAGIPCPELDAEVIRIAQVDFADGEPQCGAIDEGTPDEMLERATKIVPVLNIYIKAIEGELMRRLRESQDGTGFGHKLVRGKANRAFLDKGEAEKALVEFGFPREDLYEEPKFKSPSKIEGLRPAHFKDLGIKPKDIKAKVAELAHKPEGKITIAPITDPREPVPPSATAAADFDAVEEGE